MRSGCCGAFVSRCVFVSQGVEQQLQQCRAATGGAANSMSAWHCFCSQLCSVCAWLAAPVCVVAMQCTLRVAVCYVPLCAYYVLLRAYLRGLCTWVVYFVSSVGQLLPVCVFRAPCIGASTVVCYMQGRWLCASGCSLHVCVSLPSAAQLLAFLLVDS